ncbi:MAG: NUDIX hydrolase [Proteobacteria bacterium]|nr:NUDIX hydrolase [Pseudomonadota bacterium]
MEHNNKHNEVKFQNPHLTVDVVVFSIVNEQLCTLMIKRQRAPFQGNWALPRAEINPKLDASLEFTAKRNIKLLLDVDTPYLEQVQTIGNNERDPRGWSVSVVYYSLIAENAFPVKENAQPLKWMTINETLSKALSFDHQHIIENCYHRLQNKSLYTSLPIFLLPEEFTLTELQKTYELVLGIKMEKKSFRRRLLDAGFLQETGRMRHANHRPALLYRLSERQPYYFARIIEGVRDSKNID